MNDDKQLQATLVETWKKTRDSVEHFDKIIGELRKTTLAINVAFIPISVHVIQYFDDWDFYLIALAITVNIFNLVMWSLEKHYHLYLITSAHVAGILEARIGLDEGCRLTHMISKVKRQMQHKFMGFHFYDLLYFVSILCALGLAYFVEIIITHKSFYVLIALLELWWIVRALRRQNDAGSAFPAESSSMSDKVQIGEKGTG